MDGVKVVTRLGFVVNSEWRAGGSQQVRAEQSQILFISMVLQV